MFPTAHRIGWLWVKSHNMNVWDLCEWKQCLCKASPLDLLLIAGIFVHHPLGTTLDLTRPCFHCWVMLLQIHCIYLPFSSLNLSAGFALNVKEWRYDNAADSSPEYKIQCICDPSAMHFLCCFTVILLADRWKWV